VSLCAVFSVGKCRHPNSEHPQMEARIMPMATSFTIVSRFFGYRLEYALEVAFSNRIGDKAAPIATFFKRMVGFR
jgi:hypothetical protein